MRFVETSIFTKLIKELMSDDEYRKLQIALILRPEQGNLIRKSGGLRKIRWAMKGTGKRGGIRLIYYWDKTNETFYMLFTYPKTKQDDLTPEQLNILRRVMKEEFL
ncbi:MAG: Toxin HigB-2 [bacterium ADurb.Bin363]|nr:MAG: Toxin HigB-2 [bacterium ADurb.Bin363]